MRKPNNQTKTKNTTHKGNKQASKQASKQTNKQFQTNKFQTNTEFYRVLGSWFEFLVAVSVSLSRAKHEPNDDEYV